MLEGRPSGGRFRSEGSDSGTRTATGLTRDKDLEKGKAVIGTESRLVVVMMDKETSEISHDLRIHEEIGVDIDKECNREILEGRVDKITSKKGKEVNIAKCREVDGVHWKNSRSQTPSKKPHVDQPREESNEVNGAVFKGIGELSNDGQAGPIGEIMEIGSVMGLEKMSNL
ncbi:hypothetical protein QYF36_023843 [Acer negundo]|nr:hypothetical protein QYF36_023843 [Acer negundo]